MTTAHVVVQLGQSVWSANRRKDDRTHAACQRGLPRGADGRVSLPAGQSSSSAQSCYTSDFVAGTSASACANKSITFCKRNKPYDFLVIVESFASFVSTPCDASFVTQRLHAHTQSRQHGHPPQNVVVGDRKHRHAPAKRTRACTTAVWGRGGAEKTKSGMIAAARSQTAYRACRDPA